MTEDMIELGKRAVACKGWRWMPGMLVRCGDWLPVRMVSVDAARAALLSENALPDLTDPATVGCLLALVREAWGDPTYLPTCLDADDEAWVIESPAQERQTRYGSYASVLVRALESAP